MSYLRKNLKHEKMRPKEKAEELVNQFRIVLMNEDTDCGNEILCTSIAIKNSLIAVDEIIDFMIVSLQWDYIHNGNVDYWQEVKKEIEKLWKD